MNQCGAMAVGQVNREGTGSHEPVWRHDCAVGPRTIVSGRGGLVGTVNGKEEWKREWKRGMEKRMENVEVMQYQHHQICLQSRLGSLDIGSEVWSEFYCLGG